MSFEPGSRTLVAARPYPRGNDVWALQQRLDRLGFPVYRVDGVFGPLTAKAVSNFQRSRRLPPTGQVDPATWRALGLLDGDSPPGQPAAPGGSAPAGPAPAPPLRSPTLDRRPVSLPDSAGGYGIQIDATSRRLRVYRNQNLWRDFPCAVGKPATPSPEGRWQIDNKQLHPGGILGSRWLGLNVPWGNYGIHGTNAPWSIGRAVSNGCIRLHNENIEEIFDHVEIGTPVVIVARPGYQVDLSLGSRGFAVEQLQWQLNRLGYDTGWVDGHFGPETERAVRSFQADHGLPVTGHVDAMTWEILIEAYLGATR